jgi:E3 ubiquitin-protein ligase HUWE1
MGTLHRRLTTRTKISIKWSKPQKTAPQTSLEDGESASTMTDEDDDVEMDSDEEQEAPDLYRNSALGM